jgi:hypothetical protein
MKSGASAYSVLAAPEDGRTPIASHPPSLTHYAPAGGCPFSRHPYRPLMDEEFRECLMAGSGSVQRSCRHGRILLREVSDELRIKR